VAQRFTIAPDPPNAGEVATICYVFEGSGITTTAVVVDLKPDTLNDLDLELTEEVPCQTLTIPKDATGGFLIDSTGTSADLGFFCD
jgi:hypothetical protein